MTRPGNHNYHNHSPGLHGLDHHQRPKDPCDYVMCGPNEVCRDGCCVCAPGYKRNKYGDCVPGYDPIDQPPRPDAADPILQETEFFIFTELGFVINYDPVVSTPGDPCDDVVCSVGQMCVDGVCIPDPSYNPCDDVTCGPNEICSKGICIPDPNYNPCLGVYCDPGYYCVGGNCIRNTTTDYITQEDEGLIYTEDNKVLTYS